MKKLAPLVLILLLNIFTVDAQEYLSAEDSNPNKIGWMKGFPPHKDRVLSVADGSFFEFPAMRYSVNHMRQFMPTTVVEAATNNHYVFYTKIDNNIDTVTFTPWESNETMTWKESLSKN